jgi:hypothetical protein
MKLEYWVTTQVFLQLSQAKRKEKKSKIKIWHIKRKEKVKNCCHKKGI